MGLNHLDREVIDRLADDLRIPLYGILCHLDESVAVQPIKNAGISLTPFDSVQDVRDSL